MKSPCSKMQWSSAKLLGTPAAILDWVSVICTRNFKDGKRTDILSHCMCNHQMLPPILEHTRAAPASSAQGLGKQQGTCSSLLGGWPCLGSCIYSRNHQIFVAFQTVLFWHPEKRPHNVWLFQSTLDSSLLIWLNAGFKLSQVTAAAPRPGPAFPPAPSYTSPAARLGLAPTVCLSVCLR